MKNSEFAKPVIRIRGAVLGRRTLLRLSPLLCLVGAGLVQAQALSEGVKKAISVDAALSAIGAKPEPSGHLGLDVPDVVLPGKVQVHFSSEVAGTAWLVLLRGRKGVAPLPPPQGQPPEPALLAAQPFAAGTRATGSLKVDIAATQYLTLLALSRGRWYYVEREVKVARRP